MSTGSIPDQLTVYNTTYIFFYFHFFELKTASTLQQMWRFTHLTSASELLIPLTDARRGDELVKTGNYSILVHVFRPRKGSNVHITHGVIILLPCHPKKIPVSGRIEPVVNCFQDNYNTTFSTCEH